MASKVKSTLYSAAGVYSNQVLSFVTAAILGRLLDPKDFGLVALLLLVNGFLNLFASAGVSSVIIQFRDLRRNDLRALIGLCWMIGLALTAIAIAVAQPLASLFSAPELVEIVPIGALALLLTPVSQVVDGVLVRDNCFGLRSLVAVSSALAGSVVGVSLALLGYGYWALVVQMIVRPFAALVFGFFSIRMLPIPGFDLVLYRRVGKYAANLVGFRFLNYWSQNIDNLLIGKQLSVVDLGHYSRAYALFNLSTNMIQAVIGPVLHTSFAIVQHDVEQLRKATRDAITIIASLSMPMMGVASIYSSEIVSLAWGEQWTSAILPFSVLAIAGIFRPVQSVPSELLKAVGRTGELLRWGFFRLFIYFLAVYFGLNYGILGVGIGVSVAALINWLVYSNYVLLKVAKLTGYEIFKCYSPALKLFLVTVSTGMGLKYWIVSDFSDSLKLLASALVITCVYFIALRHTNYILYKAIVKILSNIFTYTKQNKGINE